MTLLTLLSQQGSAPPVVADTRQGGPGWNLERSRIIALHEQMLAERKAWETEEEEEAMLLLAL
jgi:hypothetical protein